MGESVVVTLELEPKCDRIVILQSVFNLLKMPADAKMVEIFLKRKKILKKYVVLNFRKRKQIKSENTKRRENL